MSDEPTLRRQAEAAIQAGRLPNRRPERMWGGPGGGACCAICGKPVEHDEAEFELQFTEVDDANGLGNYHVHVRCFTVWELERPKFEADPGASPPGDPKRSALNPCVAGVVSRPNSGAESRADVLLGTSNGGMITDRECDATNRRGSA